MKLGLQTVVLGGILEFTGIFTLLTNEESILPYMDLGFEIPVYLVSADIQGGLLFVTGSALTLYGIMQIQN